MRNYEVREPRGGIGPVQRVPIELADRAKWAPSDPTHYITLWAVDRESEQEAAVRRMKALDSMVSRGGDFVVRRMTDFNFLCDAHIAPPAPTETQLDWQTGEPMSVIHAWQSVHGTWIASLLSERIHMTQTDSQFAGHVYQGNTTTGATKQSALDNLAEIQAAKSLDSASKPG